MTLLDIKTAVDLREYSRNRYGLQFDHAGKCPCPFHPPDKSPSFSVFKGQDGAWRWKCHHDSSSGTIVDLVARIDGVSDREAIDRLLAEHRPESAPKPKPEVIREHVYLDADGHPVFKKTKLRIGSKVDWCLFHHDAGAWRPGKNGRDFIPYRLELFKDHAHVIVAEGEKDSDTINALGLDLFATSAPTGCSAWPDSITPYFSKFKEVIFLYDIGNDGHVEKHAAKLRAAFPDLSIKIATVPGSQREFDITDYLSTEPAKADAMLEILSEARAFTVKPKSTQPKPPEPAFRVSLAERGAESVKIRAIPWLWHGVMPAYMSTAITGDAGQGKSLVAVDMAARVSRGTAFPVYDKPSSISPGHVFYITSEGVPEMILVPRLMAAGADLSKITIIEGVYFRQERFSMFDITQNLPHVEWRARDFPDLKLIIVDPIASFLPERINQNQGNQVRQAMDRVSDLAFKLGIAIPTVMHFAKTPGVKAIHRTSGSVQFEASVKMSWSVIRRENDPRNVRLLVPQKSNITGGYKSLSFSIHEVEFPSPDNPAEIISTAKIIYGDHVDEDPETLISPPIEKDGDLPRAIEFLKQKMKVGGKLHSGEIIEEAKGEGIPYWSLHKARGRLGLKSAKSEFTGGWLWYAEK